MVMVKLRPSIPDFSFTTTPDYRNQLEKIVTDSMPVGIKLLARNFARSTASSYWLLRKTTKRGPQWLTLRIATHPVWLKHAQQLEILWGDPHHFDLLKNLLQTHLNQTEMKASFFQMSETDLSILKLLVELERHQLIWYIRMTPDIAQAHKLQRFDLVSDFPKTTLMLGDRNNANHLLIRMDHPEFQRKIAQLFGQNLLFSQFTKHQLLKLLPTNQWLQPIVSETDVPENWQYKLKEAYGSDFVKLCFDEIKKQSNQL